MTIDDVVKLIETCKHAGVTKLKFEKLEILFPTSDTPARVAAVPNVNRAIEAEIESDPDLEHLHAQNLMIEDPLEYEAWLIRKQVNGEDPGE